MTTTQNEANTGSFNGHTMRDALEYAERALHPAENLDAQVAVDGLRSALTAAKRLGSVLAHEQALAALDGPGDVATRLTAALGAMGRYRPAELPTIGTLTVTFAGVSQPCASFSVAWTLVEALAAASLRVYRDADRQAALARAFGGTGGVYPVQTVRILRDGELLREMPLSTAREALVLGSASIPFYWHGPGPCEAEGHVEFPGTLAQALRRAKEEHIALRGYLTGGPEEVTGQTVDVEVDATGEWTVMR